MQNTQKRCIPIFPAVLITLTSMVLLTVPKLVLYHPPVVPRLTQSVYDSMFSANVRHVIHTDIPKNTWGSNITSKTENCFLLLQTSRAQTQYTTT